MARSYVPPHELLPPASQVGGGPSSTGPAMGGPLPGLAGGLGNAAMQEMLGPMVQPRLFDEPAARTSRNPLLQHLWGMDAGAAIANAGVSPQTHLAAYAALKSQRSNTWAALRAQLGDDAVDRLMGTSASDLVGRHLGEDGLTHLVASFIDPDGRREPDTDAMADVAQQHLGDLVTRLDQPTFNEFKAVMATNKIGTGTLSTHGLAGGVGVIDEATGKLVPVPTSEFAQPIVDSKNVSFMQNNICFSGAGGAQSLVGELHHAGIASTGGLTRIEEGEALRMTEMVSRNRANGLTGDALQRAARDDYGFDRSTWSAVNDMDMHDAMSLVCSAIHGQGTPLPERGVLPNSDQQNALLRHSLVDLRPVPGLDLDSPFWLDEGSGLIERAELLREHRPSNTMSAPAAAGPAAARAAAAQAYNHAALAPDLSALDGDAPAQLPLFGDDLPTLLESGLIPDFPDEVPDFPVDPLDLDPMSAPFEISPEVAEQAVQAAGDVPFKPGSWSAKIWDAFETGSDAFSMVTGGLDVWGGGKAIYDAATGQGELRDAVVGGGDLLSGGWDLFSSGMSLAGKVDKLAPALAKVPGLTKLAGNTHIGLISALPSLLGYGYDMATGAPEHQKALSGGEAVEGVASAVIATYGGIPGTMATLGASLGELGYGTFFNPAENSPRTLGELGGMVDYGVDQVGGDEFWARTLGEMAHDARKDDPNANGITQFAGQAAQSIGQTSLMVDHMFHSLMGDPNGSALSRLYNPDVKAQNNPAPTPAPSAALTGGD